MSDDDLCIVDENVASSRAIGMPSRISSLALNERSRSVNTIDTSDESDIEEDFHQESSLAILMKKGQKFKEEREKKVQNDINKITILAKCEEAKKGATPIMIYPNPRASEAEKHVSKLKQASAFAHRSSSQDNSYNECVIIDGSGQSSIQYLPSSTHTGSRHSGIKTSFLIQDLHENNSYIESFNYDTSMSVLVDIIAKRWDCKKKEVTMTLNGESLTDLNMTPRRLGIPIDGIHPISVVRVHELVSPGEGPRDPNLITVKFQMSQGKPAMIEINRKRPFSEALDTVAEKLKLPKISKLVFDCETVNLDSTPDDLEMDDEECIDVY